MVDKLHPAFPLSTFVEIQDKKYHQQAAAPIESDFKVPNNYSASKPETIVHTKKDFTNDTKNRTNYNNKSG
jgi:hypothetical protein